MTKLLKGREQPCLCYSLKKQKAPSSGLGSKLFQIRRTQRDVTNQGKSATRVGHVFTRKRTQETLQAQWKKAWFLKLLDGSFDNFYPSKWNNVMMRKNIRGSSVSEKSNQKERLLQQQHAIIIFRQKNTCWSMRRWYDTWKTTWFLKKTM